MLGAVVVIMALVVPPDSEPQLDATRVEPSGASGTAAGFEPAVPTEPEGAEAGPELVRGAQVGRYFVVDTLGVGGMGEVFSAYDPELDRRIALKLVRIAARRDAEQARGRLLREAQALAKLSHPNVVAVYDAGTHEDRVFIAMEHVEGETLRRWLSRAQEQEPAGRWPEALALMLQAGRGLAAAHLQGLVHRDFKPANIMVSPDGRVRVLDFGLARRFGESEPEPEPELELREPVLESLDGGTGSRSSLEVQITRTGMVMGTPAYMAPEQFFGGHIDARTDQFAFCVVLYRALFGQRPFAGESFSDLGKAVAHGELREPPKASGVPRSIQAAVRRGLSVSRDDRFGTMDELLDVLERGAGQGRRRRLAAGAATVALLGLGGAAALGGGFEEAPSPCQGARAELEGVWGQERRAETRSAFAATELPYAEDARIAVERILDEHAERWVELHTEVCEATRVRGDQSEALMDLRIGCLDGRLRDVAALTEVLAAADADVVKNAVHGAQQLPSFERCATLERDASGLLRPDDPAVAAEVEQVRELVARARVLTQSGKYDDAGGEVDAALERAEATGYEPVVAEASLISGLLELRRLRAEPSRRLLEEALYVAEAVGYAEVEAEAMLGLVVVVGMHEVDTEAALRYGRHVEAVIRRMGNPAAKRAKLATYRGNVLMAASQLEAATERFAEGAELAKGDPTAERVRLSALVNLAATRGQQGKYHESAAAFTEAVAHAEEQLGPWHPDVGMCLNNLGVSHWRLGDSTTAMEHLRRALEIYDRSLAPDNPELGRAYHNLGVVQRAEGDVEGALETYERALELKKQGFGPDHPSVAMTSNNLGDLLLQMGKPREAIPLAEEAVRIWKGVSPENPTAMLGMMTIAQAHLVLGENVEAEDLARQALAQGEGAEIDPVEMVRVRFVAARAIWAAEGDRQEALSLARKARDGYRASERKEPEELAEIEAWIAERQ